MLKKGRRPYAQTGNAPRKSAAFVKKHYNYGSWTKGRFSEAVTVAKAVMQRLSLPD